MEYEVKDLASTEVLGRTVVRIGAGVLVVEPGGADLARFVRCEVVDAAYGLLHQDGLAPAGAVTVVEARLARECAELGEANRRLEGQLGSFREVAEEMRATAPWMLREPLVSVPSEYLRALVDPDAPVSRSGSRDDA